jgi:hypothetical protein
MRIPDITGSIFLLQWVVGFIVLQYLVYSGRISFFTQEEYHPREYFGSFIYTTVSTLILAIFALPFLSVYYPIYYFWKYVVRYDI